MTSAAVADRSGYAGEIEVVGQNSKYVVHAYHYWWSECFFPPPKYPALQDPFRNAFAYLELRERGSERLLFKKPVPPLTHVWIDDRTDIIVGLSNIQLCNPLQLVVFDKNGQLLHKEHISSTEACLSERQFARFLSRNRKNVDVIRAHSRLIRGVVYVNYRGLFAEIGKVSSRIIFDNLCGSRYSKNFSQSVSNWVYWYNEDEPGLEFRYEEGKIVALSMLDPKGTRFEIPIEVSGSAN